MKYDEEAHKMMGDATGGGGEQLVDDTQRAAISCIPEYLSTLAHSKGIPQGDSERTTAEDGVVYPNRYKTPGNMRYIHVPEDEQNGEHLREYEPSPVEARRRRSPLCRITSSRHTRWRIEDGLLDLSMDRLKGIP
jgi:hypothetical protein